MISLAFVWGFLVILSLSRAHPNYEKDPDCVCTGMTPEHGVGPQTGDGGFRLTAAPSGTKPGSVDVILSSQDPFE
ncbi:unnamed protein product, partial [Cyprideis torosa]